MCGLNKNNKMDIVFFIIWGVCSLWCILIIPIGNKIEKLDDSSRLKQWWKKHIADWDFYDKSK
jgi:hypothetical protein